jgi:hypothetical protein
LGEMLSCDWANAIPEIVPLAASMAARSRWSGNRMGVQPQVVEPLSSVPIGRPGLGRPERQTILDQLKHSWGEVMPSGSKVCFCGIVRVVGVRRLGTAMRAEEQK